MTAAAWRTDTRRIPVIEGETAAPWMRGPVVTRYTTPRARLARLAGRVGRSPFAADVRRLVAHRWNRALQILGGAALALLAVDLLRGLWVAAVLLGVAR